MTGGISITGINPSLNKYKPKTRKDIIEWDFIAKSIYSSRHTNPKRKVESVLKEALEDVVREVCMKNYFLSTLFCTNNYYFKTDHAKHQ